LTEFNPPHYALDSGSHAKKSQLLNWLDSHGGFLKIAAGGRPLLPVGAAEYEPICGDSICFNMGLSEHHVGLMLNEKDFIHCLFFGPRKVIVTDLTKEVYYKRRVTAIYRPMQT
jgi:hypothetical protein